MGIFGKKENKVLKPLEIILEHLDDGIISKENKMYLTNLIEDVLNDSEKNPFDNENQLVTFINTIRENPKLANKNYERIFKDAASIYKDITLCGYTFYNAFIRMFNADGLYTNGYFSIELMSVFESSESYFQIMDFILSNEHYKNNYESIKKLIIELAVYTTNDVDLRTMILDFLVNYSINGNLNEAIDDYIVLAKKRVGIYEELDDKYLARIEALLEKASEVFDLTKKEQDRLIKLQEEVSKSRQDLEKIIATYEEAVKRTDDNISQIEKKYYDRLEQQYFSLFAKLKNDADELLKTLIINSDNQAKKLANEALQKIERDVAELSQVKSRYELSTSDQLSKIEEIKNQATMEVKKGLQEIKDVIASSNIGDIEGLEKVKELLKNMPSDMETIVTPSQKIIVPTENVDVISPEIKIPEIVSCFDKTLAYKQRYDLVMDRKKMNEQNGVIYHECIEETIRHILGGRYPYLYGPSGSGKSYTVNQVADLFGIPAVEIGYITEEYELIGGRNANGAYSPSTMHDCYKYGYLAFADEFDNGVPQATVKLNGIMDSDKFPFPVVGFTKRHPNFCLVAAGNTKGTGATRAHNSRSRMDNSILERFQYIKYDYDKRVESKILSEYKEWLEFAWLYRDAVNNFWKGQEDDTIGQVTTRDIGILCDMLKEGVWTDQEILKDQFIEAKESDYIAHIKGYLNSHANGSSKKTLKLINEFVGLVDNG